MNKCKFCGERIEKEDMYECHLCGKLVCEKCLCKYDICPPCADEREKEYAKTHFTPYGSIF